MSDNYKWFSHTKCEYYPCHNIKEMNCLFCYCPLYNMSCPGMYKILPNGLKDCTDCDYPHKRENYSEIVKLLVKESKKW